MARHIYTYVNPTSRRDLQQACQILEGGGVIAYPTDVNWALGCDPASKKALEKIRSLKPGHSKDQPFSLMCDSLAMVASVAHIENFAYRLMKKNLPGAYTFLLQRTRELPRLIKDKRPLVGVRVPESLLLPDLIREFGGPIATTSLPQPKHLAEPLRFGYEIDQVYGHALELILDPGEQMPPDETTIVDLSQGAVQIIRPGRGPITPFETLITAIHAPPHGLA